MVELTRTVRFSVNPGTGGEGDVGWGEATNTFAAYPTMRGLGRHYELDVHCRGEADAATGYFLNIKAVDAAARRAALPVIFRACRERPEAEPGEVLRDVLPALAGELPPGSLVGVTWRLSPYYGVEMRTSSPDEVLLRQQFDFAAAHRLHVPGLSDAENRAIFGKCNNPRGHGHNYRVEPCVAVRLGGGGRGDRGPVFTLEDLERVTRDVIINRFDHTHLNEDTREFASDGGLNPSVENMAKVFFELLAPAVAAAGRGDGKGGGARLVSVCVWETDKTRCVYPAV